MFLISRCSNVPNGMKSCELRSMPISSLHSRITVSKFDLSTGSFFPPGSAI